MEIAPILPESVPLLFDVEGLVAFGKLCSGVAHRLGRKEHAAKSVKGFAAAEEERGRKGQETLPFGVWAQRTDAAFRLPLPWRLASRDSMAA